MPDRLGRYLRAHVEELFVASVLGVTLLLFLLIPYKLAFLNFFYLPVFVAGFFLGARKSILGSVLCMLLVGLYAAWRPGDFSTGGTWMDTFFNITSWGGFLILAGGIFGLIQEKLHREYGRIQRLNETLAQEHEVLEATNRDLSQVSEQRRRDAEHLRQKNVVIEGLKKKLESTLYSTIDPTVARMMLEGRLQQDKREVSVLFVDLKEFTTYASQFPAETITGKLNEFYSGMEPVVERFYGHLDKYMGDAMMCEFGVPIHHDQHVLQATLTAYFMLKAAERKKYPWAIRVGLATGTGIVGLVGARRRNYTVIGEVSNLANRLESLAGEGEAYLDETAAQYVEKFFDVEQVRSFSVRRQSDERTRQQIAELEYEVTQNPRDPDLHFDAGRLYFSLREASEALKFFEKALSLDPSRPEFKLAYADASLKRDEFEKIEIRGFSRRVRVFRLGELKNPLQDRGRFPKSFSARYGTLWQRANLPHELILSHESIDGSLGHSQVVAALSYALAERMNFPREIQQQVFWAGCLQDLGKSTVPHHLLNRGGPLSPEEFKEVEGHVERSVSLAKQMGCDKPSVLKIIENHHESSNGRGYPNGKVGDEIPIGAQITAVADGYSALTRWRPYRPPWDRKAALDALHSAAAAGRYDANIVQMLGKILEQPTSI